MEHFRVRPVSEADIDAVIAAAGGGRAHTDAARRDKPGADYLLGEAVLELKALDDEGLKKPERQAKLAALFSELEKPRPVVVLDRAMLPEDARRAYDRILEGPIKTAVSTARKQLKQSKSEFSSASVSVLFIVNNGYTALNHEELVQIVAHRVRNDTKEIDGVVVAGCYFYSDGFDSYFLWPIDYIPINLHFPFASYERLRNSWNDYSQEFMTAIMQGRMGLDAVKGPIVDTQFEVDGVTYVKPAPPLGKGSQFFDKGRPRKDTSGLAHCPPVATTFPDMTREEWILFRKALPHEDSLFSIYEEWQAHRAAASNTGIPLRPFVAVSITYHAWETWCNEHHETKGINSIRRYANALFENRLRAIMATSRERQSISILPSRYVLAVTEEIGQDRANDLSHIFLIREMMGSEPAVHALATDVRIFHEYALTLACAYAVAEGAEIVLWQKDLRYAWV
jgi:hypothetical protein